MINRWDFMPVLTAGLEASEHLHFFFVSLLVLTASLQSSAHFLFLVSLPVLTVSLYSSARLVFLVNLPVLTVSLESSEIFLLFFASGSHARAWHHGPGHDAARRTRPVPLPPPQHQPPPLHARGRLCQDGEQPQPDGEHPRPDAAPSAAHASGARAAATRQGNVG